MQGTELQTWRHEPKVQKKCNFLKPKLKSLFRLSSNCSQHESFEKTNIKLILKKYIYIYSCKMMSKTTRERGTLSSVLQNSKTHGLGASTLLSTKYDERFVSIPSVIICLQHEVYLEMVRKKLKGRFFFSLRQSWQRLVDWLLKCASKTFSFCY